MSEDITKTDLTHEVPTGRAVVHRSLRQFEMVKVEAKMPGWLGGTTFKLTAHVHAGSPQSTGLTTLLLIGAASLLAGVAVAIGIPAMTALITGLCVPVGTYALIRFFDVISNRKARL